MELWDIYDVNKNKLNKTIRRDSAQRLQDGEYHLVVEAIILNSKNEILISKRAKTKEKYPLYWECNGGAVKSGETSKQGILRELREELGVNFDEMKKMKDRGEFIPGKVIDKEEFKKILSIKK